VILPFSADQFFAVFSRYNDAVWPMQWVLNGLGVIAAVLLWRGQAVSMRVVAAVLAVLWIWSGIVYHLVFFTAINPAAWLFGIVFSVAGLWFAWGAATLSGSLERREANSMAWAGWMLIAYAMLIYPALGYALGHRYPAFPTFGLPCPITLFTIGVLIVADAAYRRSFFIAPLLWTGVGSAAAIELGVIQDLGLMVAGGAGLLAVLRRPTEHSGLVR
jgi:hypothetical protein